jgi:hypothetical protein
LEHAFGWCLSIAVVTVIKFYKTFEAGYLQQLSAMPIPNSPWHLLLWALLFCQLKLLQT